MTTDWAYGGSSSSRTKKYTRWKHQMINDVMEKYVIKQIIVNCDNFIWFDFSSTNSLLWMQSRST